MSFLSKLFGGDKNAEKAAKDILNGLFSANNSAAPAQNASQSTAEAAAPAVEQASSFAPSGYSWGENMPSEPNQYNYQGSFTQYFEDIFFADFSQYRFEREDDLKRAGKRVIYTFYSGAARVLVVELLSEKCSVYKLRKQCAGAGVPYCRFYHDHDGWWNTRAYVVDRINAALKG